MTSTELDRVTGDQPAPSSLPAKMEYARALAVSSLLPKSYRNQPANVLMALELGQALGIPPIQAITGIHVIEGKPSASSELIGSLVRRAGHKLRIHVDHAGKRVKAELIRSDDPEHTFVAVWDMARAQQAGLAGKENWKKDPIAMLTARAVTQVARQGAPDALYGVSHVPEELDWGVPQVRQLHENRVTAAEILNEDVVDAEVQEGEPVEADMVDERTEIPLTDLAREQQAAADASWETPS